MIGLPSIIHFFLNHARRTLNMNNVQYENIEKYRHNSMPVLIDFAAMTAQLLHQDP